MWERELDAASRWFCIDRRILKASPEMYDRAEMLAKNVNGFLYDLHPQIKELEGKITLQGIDSDHAFRHLLWSKVLLQLAEHALFKWNIIWKEIGNGKRRCDECGKLCCDRCGERRCRCANWNGPYNLHNCDLPPSAQEMPIDSDDDW